MPAAGENSELYRDHQSSVSPTWLINGKSRYAVKNLVKLEFHKISQPRARAGFMMLLGILLSVVSARYILTGAQPYLIPLIMLTGSVTLMVGGACVLYMTRTRFRIDMTLLDGSCVSLRRNTPTDAENLLAGLSAAMDWHLGADQMRPSQARASRLRQGIARARDAQVVESAGSPTLKTVAKRPVVSPVVATEPTRVTAKIVPLLKLLKKKRYRRPVD